MKHVGDIMASKPVLGQGGRGKVQNLCNRKRKLPHTTVKVKDEARARRAKRFDLFEATLHIPQFVHQVGKDDDIEGAFDVG